MIDGDSDGIREVITEQGIYYLNGSLLYDSGFNTVAPIAVDIDGNTSLDLLWSYGNYGLMTQLTSMLAKTIMWLGIILYALFYLGYVFLLFFFRFTEI